MKTEATPERLLTAHRPRVQTDRQSTELADPSHNVNTLDRCIDRVMERERWINRG